MKTSKTGRDFIKKYEGLRLESYQCEAGVWTIGYGHTSDVTSGMTCTEQQADAWLADDLGTAENAVNAAGLHLSQQQFDALVSFTFNVGNAAFTSSTLLKLLKQSTEPRKELKEQFLRWKFAGGAVSLGLLNRRMAEYNMYSNGFFLG